MGFSPQQKFAREMVFEERNRRYIESQLEKFFHTRYVLSSSQEAASVKEKPPEKQVKKRRKAREDEDLKDEPVIRRFIEEFDGEVIKKRRSDKGETA